MENQNTTSSHLPIGVFDSGIGGLTVLRALHHQLPQESFLYLGDTARLPYGTKSPKTLIHYTLNACEALVKLGVKALVIACNTASAYALPALQEAFPHLPIFGVIEPGAKAAVAVSQTHRIAIIATEATIQNKAYETAILTLAPNAIVSGASCPVFVALAEEGWTQGPIATAVAREYLTPLFDVPSPPDCLVLGCTHFPVLKEAIQSVLPSGISLVDSAITTAQSLHETLGSKISHASAQGSPSITFLATDNPHRFLRVAKNLLHVDIAPSAIELIDI